MTATMALHLLAVALLVSFRLSAAEIREEEVRSDGRSIIPFDVFGFTHGGVLELNVSGISLPDGLTERDLHRLGFFLTTHDAWIHVVQQVLEGNISCALESPLVKVVYSLNKLSSPNNPSGVSIPRNTSFKIVFAEKDPGQYALLFANCLYSCRVSMTVRNAMYNFDPRTQHRAYLSVGDAALPLIYFLFFLAYADLAAAWVAVLLRKRHTALSIHYFMLAVLILKALNLLCEAEYKSFIKGTGSAHGWDVLFYIFSFLMGISLFTLIVLIGTGWSFLKPYLQDRDKKVLMVVIPLQVVANIAQVVIYESGPYGSNWVTWRQVFLLVDVVCCCAVLFPIVWSIKNLREAARTDGKAAVNLSLFRQYFIVVFCYINFTRVVVYALGTMASYRYTWISVVAGELATLSFYVFTGYKFRPEVYNPYLVIDNEKEKANDTDEAHKSEPQKHANLIKD